MTASLHEILSTKITTKVVSREAGANKYILTVFGMQPGGSAERQVGHRSFGYDIFNDTRTVSQGRGPGTAAATVRRQAVGRVDGTFPRFYEKLPLLSEELHNFRVIGGPTSVYDERGVQYVAKQQRYMGQRIGNARLTLLAGMIRGKIYGTKSGDDCYYSFTSSNSTFTIDWQRDSGNYNQLNYQAQGNIITTSWANPAADIPSHLGALNAALQSVTGTTLQLIICPNDVWRYVLSNDAVQAQAGIGNAPFTQYERIVGTDANGRPQTVIMGTIAAIPWVRWIVTNEGIKLGTPGSETFVQFIPNGNFWFGPEPTTDLYEMLLGSEPVNEGYGAPETVRYGVAAWTKQVDDPSGRMLFVLDNAIPADYIPLASGLATCVF
jgi:hypothetical protein